MTERERWIVYPLLFLALGALLRDKLVGSHRHEANRVSGARASWTTIRTAAIPPHVYAKIGRSEATGSTPALGYLLVNGEVGINGIVNVNGVVNAGQYMSSPEVPASAKNSGTCSASNTEK